MSTTKKPTQILSYLYLGGKSDAKSKESLEELNIKYILNCTPQRVDDPEFGCPNFFQKDKTFVYKRIPIFDNKGEDILPHLDSAFKFIEEGQHYGNVLVHCHKGVSRSASFVIGYLMRKNEFTFDEALLFVQSVRPVVQPNEAFITQLQSYNPHINTTIANTSNLTTCGPDTNINMDVSQKNEVSFNIANIPDLMGNTERDQSIDNYNDTTLDNDSNIATTTAEVKNETACITCSDEESGMTRERDTVVGRDESDESEPSIKRAKLTDV
jgi:protein-tyrosine phosphatase